MQSNFPRLRSEALERWECIEWSIVSLGRQLDYRPEAARLSNFRALRSKPWLGGYVFSPLPIFEIPVNDAADSGFQINTRLPVQKGSCP